MGNEGDGKGRRFMHLVTPPERSKGGSDGGEERTRCRDMISLEGLLEVLERYGRPRLCRIGSGWFCKNELRVNCIGANFEVTSEWGHDTPISAARQCLARTLAAVDARGE